MGLNLTYLHYSTVGYKTGQKSHKKILQILLKCSPDSVNTTVEYIHMIDSNTNVCKLSVMPLIHCVPTGRSAIQVYMEEERFLGNTKSRFNSTEYN